MFKYLLSICFITLTLHLRADDVPSDLKDVECFVGISCKESVLVGIVDKVLSELKNINLQVSDFAYFDQNPTIRVKKSKEISEKLKKNPKSYKYFINVVDVFVSTQNRYVYVLTISNFNSDDILNPKNVLCYFKANTIEKLVEKLDSKYKKQLK